MAQWAGGGEETFPGALAFDDVAAGERAVSSEGGQGVNPHSDLIFRATGAESCRDCHEAEKGNRISRRVLENELVKTLRSRAKGVHGPGRFADCLRCHAGGKKGVEKY